MELTEAQKENLKKSANGSTVKLLNQIYADSGRVRYPQNYETLFDWNYHCMAYKLEKRLSDSGETDSEELQKAKATVSELEKKLAESEKKRLEDADRMRKLEQGMTADSIKETPEYQKISKELEQVKTELQKANEKVLCSLRTEEKSTGQNQESPNDELARLRTFRNTIEKLLQNVQQDGSTEE